MSASLFPNKHYLLVFVWTVWEILTHSASISAVALTSLQISSNLAAFSGLNVVNRNGDIFCEIALCSRLQGTPQPQLLGKHNRNGGIVGHCWAFWRWLGDCSLEGRGNGIDKLCDGFYSIVSHYICQPLRIYIRFEHVLHNLGYQPIQSNPSITHHWIFPHLCPKHLTSRLPMQHLHTFRYSPSHSPLPNKILFKHGQWDVW
jgi:hypothetical protein